MTTVVAAGRRVLPRGYADLARQLVIWFGFLFVYQIARGLADRHPARAFANGIRVIDFEQRTTHHLFELTFQNLVSSSSFLADAVSWTYWNSEFTVVCLALLWVYIRRHDAFPWLGFVDSHRNGLVQLAANPYAAMPSLHAADALILGIVLATIVRRPIFRLLWVLWPAWVWFCVMATGNHFWLDILAGDLVALLALAAVYRRPIRRFVAKAR